MVRSGVPRPARIGLYMKLFIARALAVVFPCVAMGMAMAQIAVLQIKVLDGEGAVHPPGAHVSHPLTVEVMDENGRPVPGAAVSFQLPPEGASGLFSNGLRTDLVLTDTAGRAAIHAVQLNRTGGLFRIRITAVKEQARAGAVSTQYIAENKAVIASENKAAAPTGAAKEGSGPAPATAKSGEITPTTAKMGSRSHKKWIVIAAIAAGAGVAAFAGISHSSSSSSSSPPSSVVSIGTPGITVGRP
jgi:hypothetical protein